MQILPESVVIEQHRSWVYQIRLGWSFPERLGFKDPLR